MSPFFVHPSLRAIRHVFFDFESTLVTVEGLEVLARVVEERRAERGLEDRVRELTDRAMAGGLDFGEATRIRIDALRPMRSDLAEAACAVAAALDPDAAPTLRALAARGLAVTVVSGGLRELIGPALGSLDLPACDIACNSLLFDGDMATGMDTANPLARDGGKAEVIRARAAASVSALVGDGANDLAARRAGAVAAFIAHVGVRHRQGVASEADHVIHRLPELLELLP